MRSIDPATGETVWEGPASTTAEIDAAIGAARKAFTSWSQADRLPYLEQYTSLLKDNRTKLATQISLEMGKPLWESEREVDAMVGKVAISIEAESQRCPDRTVGPVHLSHRPHGVVAIFGPYNFPGHLANGHYIPALIAGNTVVFKPSELTPGVGALLADLWSQTGLPGGVFNLVQGAADVGAHLASHPGIDGLFFVGSGPTGRAIAKNLPVEKICALEMGGNNPLVIGSCADIEAAAYLTVESAYITSGQRCTCARRLILLPQAKPLLDALVALIDKLTVAPFTATPQPYMGPILGASKIRAAEKRLKGRVIRSVGDEGNFLRPGLVEVQETVDEEFFGPLLQVIHVPNMAAAISEANKTRYGLSAGILTDDLSAAGTFVKQARAGIINVNAPLTGASSAAPFGGIGWSGNHRPSAYYAADYCSYPVASIAMPQVTLPKTLNPGIGL